MIKKLVNNTLTSEEIKWGNEVKIGYYDQEQATLNSRESILQEVWTKFPHEEEAKIRTILGNFLFNGEDVFKKISALSGGEKARVALTELMLENANVLLLDEPTNHLDLFTKEILETALLNYEGTIFFISHDRYFINKVATRILELQPTGVTNYNGNYDDYIRSKSHSKKSNQLIPQIESKMERIQVNCRGPPVILYH